MKTNKTAAFGAKTNSVKRHSALNIAGKDPNYDYSYRRISDIEQGGGQDIYGYEPVGTGNSSGETWDVPTAMKTRTGNAKQIRYQDVILCRRHKDVAKFFQAQEDEKYNAQVRLVQSAQRVARDRLREINPDSVVVDQAPNGEKLENAFKQRVGPTAVEPEDVIEVDERTGKPVGNE